MRNRDIKNKSNFNSIPRDGDRYSLISNWKKLYAKKPKFSASVPAAAAAIVASFGPTLPVFALPEGLTVKQGNLTTQTSDNTLTINQGTNRAFGDWNSFDIQSNETVNINQPTVDSIMVGRITGGSRTEIFGNLNSTGGVILINPKGMLFGAEAQINTASFSASTLDISPHDFGHSNDVTLNKFDTNSLESSIINFGAISVSDTGLVSLIAPQVVNEGVISAKLGKVQLASGTSATLDLSGDGLLNIALDEKAAGIIKNTGTIEGQNIRIGGGVASSFVNSTVNIDGFVQATGFDQDSSVDVQSSGDIFVDGKISSSESNTVDNGGSIKILGNRIAIEDDALVTTSGTNGGGEILIGGNYLGKGPEPNASATVILDGAVISADSLVSGDGGRVIVWSDDYTNFRGLITAKGTSDGKGGFVETSSKDNLQVFGSVDAYGGIEAGEWLLDPSDVTIGSSTSTGNFYSALFEPDTTSATVSAASIKTSLETVHVTISTHLNAADADDAGSITFASGVTLENINTKASGRRLTFFAAEDINVSETISSSGGPLSIRLKAMGDVSITNNADIITKGGSFSVSGANADGDPDTEMATAETAGSFLLDSGSEINTTGATGAAGGAVTIKTSVRSTSVSPTTDGDIEIKGNITTSGGTASSAGLAGGAVTLNAGLDSAGNTAGTIEIFTGADITTSGSAAANSSGGAGAAAGAVTFDTNGETIVLNDTTITAIAGAADGGGASASGGTITFSDNVSIATNGVTLTTGSTGGNIDFSGTIDGSTTLSLTSGTGTIGLSGIVGGGTNLTGLTISSSALTIDNNISVAGDVSITAPVTLGGNVTIDTNTAGTDGDITFSSTINGSNTLTLDSGSGAVAIQGAIGTTGTGIGNLDINQSGGTGTIEVFDIGDSGNVGVTGTVNIGNSATTSITLDGTTYKFDGNAEFDSTATGASIMITGGNTVFTTQSDHTLAFTTADVELSGTDGADPDVGLTTFTAPGGLTFAGDIIGKSGMSGTESLTIETAANNLDITGSIGNAGKAIGTLTINSSGAGTVALAGIGTDSAVGVSGNAAIGNANTATITLDGAEYNTTGTQTYQATAGGNINVTGTAATIATAGNNITFSTAGVNFKNDGTTTITTGTSGGGDVSFAGAIEADGTADVLTVISGTGTITFSDVIGKTEELAGLNVNPADTDGSGAIVFAGDIGFADGGGDTAEAGVLGNTVIGNANTTSIDFQEDLYSFGTGTTNIQAATGHTIDATKNADTIEFKTAATSISFETGDIDLDDGTNLSIASSGGAITVFGIDGDSSETVTISAGSGVTNTEFVTVGDIGTANQILSVSITAGDKITLQGNIDTADAANPNISFTGPVEISGDVTVSSDNTTNDGTIGFSSTIDGASSGTNNLTVLSGSGTPTFSGRIGKDVALNNLSINATDTGTGDTASISIAEIGDATGGSLNAGANTVTIGSSDTTSVTLSGTFYRTDGNIVITTKSGTDKITFSGANPTVTTSGDLIDLNGGDVKLANNTNLTINSNFGNASANGGNIEIAGAIAGTSSENLTITTGTAGTTGSVTLSGNVGAASGSASQISTLDVDANATITIGGDIVTSGEDGDATHPDILLTGAVVLSGTTQSIVTDVGGTTDGDITITGTLNGTDGVNNDLTLDSGGGAISITDAIGSGTNGALRDLTINTTNHASEAGTISIEDIGTGTASSGVGVARTTNIGNTSTATLTLSGTVYNTGSTAGGSTTYESVTGANKILITGTNPHFSTHDTAITFDTGSIKLSAGEFEIDSNGGSITVDGAIIGTDAEEVNFDAGTSGGNADITLSSTVGSAEITKVTLDGEDGVNLSGDITLTADAGGLVSITGPVTLNAAIAIDSSASDGNITFETSGTTINGGNTLTLTSGGGAVAIQGAIGTTGTGIGNLDINQSGGTGTIEVFDIGDSGNVGVTGTVNIGNSATTSITLDGTTYKFDGNAEFDSTATGASIMITGGNTVFTTQSDHTLAFTTADVELSGTDGADPDVGLTTFTAPGGLTFAGDIIGKSGMSGTESLTIETAANNLDITGSIGNAGKAIGTLTINSSGAGTVALAGIGTDSAVGVSGNAAIGNANTATITLDGAEYNTTGTQTYQATAGGNINVTGTAATIATAGNNITFSTAGVNFKNDGTTTITTGTSGGGDVSFAGAIEADGTADVLTVISGTGTITFSDVIGKTEELAGLNVNPADTDGSGAIVFAGDIGFADGGGDTAEAGVLGNTVIGNANTTSIDFQEDLYSFGTGTTNIQAATGHTIDATKNADTIEFKTAATSISFETGDIDLDDGTNLSIASSGGAITVFGIDGDSSETVTISAGSGVTNTEFVTVGDIGTANQILSVSITAGDKITLQGNIDTADAANPNISFTGPVEISGDVTVSSDNTTNDGTIGFSSTIDGASSGTNNLTVLSGSGTPTFSGRIGKDVALNNLSINATDTGTGDTASISIAEIGDATGGSLNAGANTVTIGSSDTTSVTLSGTFYRTDGNIVITTKSGTDKITFSGANPTVTTSGDLIDLNGGDVKLANNTNLTINSNFGNASANGGNIEIAGAIAGTSSENLTITTGTAGTTGSVTLSGNVGAASGSASQISTLDVDANATITIGGDIVTSGEDGDATHPDILLTGAVVLSGTTQSIVTDVGGTTDGDITITGTLNGTDGVNNDLTLDSGGGAISITDAIGSGTNGALRDLTINTTNHASEAGTISIEDIGTGTASSGVGVARTTNIGNTSTATLTLSGTVYNTGSTAGGSTTYESVTGANKILITGTNPHFSTHDTAITFDTGSIKLSAGEFEIDSNGGSITVDGAIIGTDAEEVNFDAGTSGGNADITLSSTVGSAEITKVTLDGEDGVNLSGDITLTADAGGLVSITGPVTLNAAIAIDSSASDGNITFETSGTTINGGNTLTLTSGGGAVAIQGAIGTTGTGIGNLDINQSGGTGTIEVFDIGDSGNVGVTGTVNIGNSATTSITLDGTTYKFDGNAEFDSTATGASIMITGGNTVFTTQSDHTLAFTTADVELSGTDGADPDVGLTTFTAPGGLTFAGDIIGKSGMSGTESLTIETAANNLDITGSIGNAGKAIGTLTINSSGAGTVALAGIGTDSAVGVSGNAAIGNANTATITLDGAEYNTTGTQTYQATAGGNINVTGTAATIATAGNNITFSTAGVNFKNDGTTTITTGTSGGGDVSFAGAIEADGTADVLTVISGTGTITFSDVIGKTEELAGLNVNPADTDGSGAIVFAGDIGFADGGGDTAEAGVLGNTVIGNANTTSIDFQEDLYSFGTGTTNIQAATGHTIDATKNADTIEFKTAATSISFETGDIDLDDGTNLSIASSGGAITVFGIAGDSDEVVTINADGGSTSTETVSLGDVGDSDHTQIHTLTVTADDGITLTGNIYTSADSSSAGDVTFNDKVIIDGAVSIDTDNTGDTTSTDGIIKFSTSIQSETNGTDSLTLTSGAGTITLVEVGGSSKPLTSFVATSNALTISNDITTTGLIDINAPVTLGADVVISSGTGAGNVEFSSTIAGTQNLDILSGSGAVTITGNIGGGGALTSLDINATGASTGTGNINILGNIGADGTSGAGIVNIGNSNTGTITLGTSGTESEYFTTGAQTYDAATYSLVGTDPDFNASSENISFLDGASGITLATGSDLTVDTAHDQDGNITIEGEIGSTSGQTTTVTIEAGSGTVSVAAMATGIGNVTLDGSGGVTLNGNITTNGGNIDINEVTTLGGAVALTTAGGTVDFASTINGNENFDISSGSGAVSIGGTIGGDTALATLDINNTGGSGTITLNDIGDANTQGVTGDSNIGNAATNTLTLSGTTYKTDAVTYTTKAGENIDLTAEADTTFTTSDDSITFGTGTLEMADGSNLIINTGTGGGAIELPAGVMGTTSENITLTAGTGNVTVGAIGTGTEIADVTITSTGTTKFNGDFIGGTLKNTGPVIAGADINIGTGAVTFGGTLDSLNGSQAITFNTPGFEISITGAIGGTNAFETFTITDADKFTYSGGGSIAGFKSGKFSRTGGFAIFNPGPSIDNINTIKKTKDKEIAFFDAPVFKLFKSFVTPTVTDLIKEKAPTPEVLPEITVAGPARTNSQFLEKESNIGTEIKDADIQVDFLDGDILIIDKSLEVVTTEFESLETINDILDDIFTEDSSDLSINSTGKELFKISSTNEIDDNSVLQDLLISFSNNQDINQGKSFIF